MKMISLLILGMSLNVLAAPKKLWVTIGSDVQNAIEDKDSKLKTSVSFKEKQGAVSVAEIDANSLPEMSELMHHSFNRCGGFIVHDSKEEAMKYFKELPRINSVASKFVFVNYSIDQTAKVESMTKLVDEFSIRSVITNLSNFHNRYYTADTGVESQKWLKAEWERLSQNRSDISVDFFTHKNWPQPSIILTIEGTEQSDEIVVIGGHADSIAANWLGVGSATAKAPGADDNASGIATITEALKILVNTNYRPKRTLKFMAYAAEEVGLKGSNEIARSFKRDGKNVVGKIQFDMTNFNGTGSQDIVMMNDYTNEAQNDFVGRLIDTYVGVPWGYDKCGYGCSDHASWHNQGFPATMPFEARFRDMNSKIHTKHDTIEQSGGNADHAVKFAKLAVAFMVEMGK